MVTHSMKMRGGRRRTVRMRNVLKIPLRGQFVIGNQLRYSLVSLLQFTASGFFFLSIQFLVSLSFAWLCLVVCYFCAFSDKGDNHSFIVSHFSFKAYAEINFLFALIFILSLSLLQTGQIQIKR